jgi:Rod binding domain-containing protein
MDLSKFKILKTSMVHDPLPLSGAKKLSSIDNSLASVADQFEAIFIESLLKQARESKLSQGLFDTSSDDTFVEMFDKEIANSTSQSVDIGIAQAIVEQMSLGKHEPEK